MLSFRDHSKPWGLESVVIFPFFDVCLWFIYIFFWLVLLLFFWVTLLFKGCFVFYLGVGVGGGWWFWIDFGGVFFWGGGGSGEGWKIMFRISVICHQCDHDYQNNSYCILIVITWYLLHRSMYELLIEFVVSSESHFRKWKKNPKQIPILVYLYRNNYNLLITRCVYNPWLINS